MSEVAVGRKRGRKGHAAGHHGGAWKVAYADFVTALMAFFIVMWIVGMSDATRKGISNYFNNPTPFKITTSGAGPPRFEEKDQAPVGPPPADWSLIIQERIAEQIKEEIKKLPELKELSKYLEYHTDKDGLRIELVEEKESLFFESGSAKMQPAAVKLLEVIAQPLSQLPNAITIEGHTDATPYTSKPDYSNWELSADRANAARRVVEPYLGAHLDTVTGFADRKLREPKKPDSFKNRRVSILVRPGGPEASPGAEVTGGAGGEPKEPASSEKAAGGEGAGAKSEEASKAAAQ